MKKLSMLLKSIVKSAVIWSKDPRSNKVSVVIKKTRKPRKRKIKTPIEQVKKLNFLKESPEFKLKSICPTKIVGAKQLWVFNTKYRYLGVYCAENDFGFTVKGSTIQNFDQEKSIEYKLRKPTEPLKKVQEGGKVELRHVFDYIKTKERKLTGRMNQHTIILRAL